MINKNIFLAALLQQKGIGHKTLLSILDKLHFDEVLNYRSEENLVLKKAVILAKKTLEKLEVDLKKHKINVTSVLDENYPRLLQEVPDKPVVLYYKGNIELLNQKTNIAFVGTRNITEYGKRHVNNLIRGISHLPLNIVSGMAFGVDAAAHEAAISNKLPTTAVLAGSVHKSSPVQNSHIYSAILENGGLIISEFSPNVKVVPGMFALRNRIVAGISKATVIIEAGEKSGSLITGSLAFDYNREVFALPGSVDSQYSKGSNKIIKKGIANLIDEPSDLIEHLGFSIVKNSSTETKQKLNDAQKKIYDIIISSPKHLEELATLLNKEVFEVSQICFELEMIGVVGKDVSGRYIIK
ncbi:MAG: DNA-processing protein DprA [Candidatus Dojkabacteria bacterium]